MLPRSQGRWLVRLWHTMGAASTMLVWLHRADVVHRVYQAMLHGLCCIRDAACRKYGGIVHYMACSLW